MSECQPKSKSFIETTRIRIQNRWRMSYLDTQHHVETLTCSELCILQGLLLAPIQTVGFASPETMVLHQHVGFLASAALTIYCVGMSTSFFCTAKCFLPSCAPQVGCSRAFVEDSSGVWPQTFQTDPKMMVQRFSCTLHVEVLHIPSLCLQDPL